MMEGKEGEVRRVGVGKVIGNEVKGNKGRERRESDESGSSESHRK